MAGNAVWICFIEPEFPVLLISTEAVKQMLSYAATDTHTPPPSVSSGAGFWGETESGTGGEGGDTLGNVLLSGPGNRAASGLRVIGQGPGSRLLFPALVLASGWGVG